MEGVHQVPDSIQVCYAVINIHGSEDGLSFFNKPFLTLFMQKTGRALNNKSIPNNIKALP
jgi:hypothetical protein